MSFGQDVRFALRLLRKSPAFTVIAVLTLGLAVGANTVVFSVVSGVLLKPLPYAEPDRLVRLDTQFPSMGFDKFWVSAPEYLTLARDAQSYASVGAWTIDRVNLSGGVQPLAVDAIDGTASLLPTLGTSPMLGRFFDASEDTPGDPRAIVISYGLWQRAFAADPAIVGKTVHVDAVPVSVVGVMPKGFEFPNATTDAWLPLRIDPATARPASHSLTVVARLRPGVDLRQARAELASLVLAWSNRPEPRHRIRANDHPMVAAALHDDLVGPVRVALITLQIAVGFVLLIACANVSNLLLARAEARSGEIAVRAAIGATRGRMARQFLTESLVLGALGAGVGVVLAVWGIDAAVALLPGDVPRAHAIAIDKAVLAFAVAISLVASLLFGLAPILHAHGNLGEALRGAAARTTSGARKQIFRRALVVVEVGLAVVLVAGAGLMARSFMRLQHVDLGFEPRGLVTLDLQIPEKAYPRDSDVYAFWSRLREGAAALPGVKSAAVVYGAPPLRALDANDFDIPGRPRVEGEPPRIVDFWQFASEDAFATLGLRVVAGRGIDRTDTATSQPVVVINQALAQKYFAGEDPLGKRIKLSGSPGSKEDAQQTIVGVVADVKNAGMDARPGTEAFVPFSQTREEMGFAPRSEKLLLRTDGDPRAVLGSVRAFVASIDPSLPVAYLQTMDQVVAESIGKPRFVMTLLAVFAGIALLMAAIGIYGVMAYTVERRTQDLGIRMALGADGPRLQAMLVGQGLALAGLGMVVGLVAAAGMTVLLGKWFAQLLFEVGSLDPLTYAVAIPLMLGVAALACYVPARRATLIHPMRAMRHE